MEEFFNSSEDIVQRLEFKRSENTVHMQPKQKTSRPLGRPTCTGWYTVAVRSIEWSIDCMTQVSVESRSTALSTDWHEPCFYWGSVDRPEGKAGQPKRSTNSQICLSYQDSNSISDPESNQIMVS